MPSSKSHHNKRQRRRRSFWFRIAVIVLVCGSSPAEGLFVLPTYLGLAVWNPFLLVQQLGLLSFDNFFDDLLNLFWGKRRLLCGMKLIALASGNDDRSNFFGLPFRDDSAMILPEAGIYQGPDDIQEYVAFATNVSPYITFGPDLPFFQPRVVGYNDEGECEFLWSAVNTYRMDEAMTETTPALTFGAPILLKLFSDYNENYVRRVYVHYTQPFLAFFFGNLATRAVAEFMCDTVWARDDCTRELGAPPDDCIARMLELPLASDNLYMDGDSFGCRLLHAAFANTNARHCSHMSLDPNDTDPAGKRICSESLQLPHTEYFTEQEMTTFVQWAQGHGVDPAVGYLPM